MTLHPALAHLEASYVHLLGQVDRGEVSIDDAYVILDQMRVADGSGAVWTVSPDHEPPATVFLRILPGSAPLPTDPAQFVPTAVAPSSGWVPGGWQEPHAGPQVIAPEILTPPQSPSAQPFGTSPHPSVPGPMPGPGMPGPGMPGPGMPGPGMAGPARDPRFDPRLDSSGASPGPGPYRVPPGPVTHSGPDRAASRTSMSQMDEPSGRSRPSLAGVGARLGGGLGALTGRLKPTSARTAGAVVGALVVLVGVVVVARPSAGPAPVDYACPPLSATVTGVPDGPTAELIGCLDQDGLATFVVDSAADGQLVFAPSATVPLGATLAGAVVAYSAAGGPTPPAPALDLSTQPPQFRVAITQAAGLGLVDPARLDATAASTRADLAVELYAALRAAGRTLPSGTPAADATGIASDAITAQAALAAAGIADTATGTAFRFTAPVTRAEWVVMVGRTLFEARQPGRLAAALTPPSTTPATPTVTSIP